MNRNELKKENLAIQRRYESHYFPKVKASINSTVHETISAVKSHGVHGGISFLNKKLQNKGLIITLENMVVEVGGRFSKRTWTQLNRQKRQKGFGFNPDWIDRIKDLLRNFIVQQSYSIFSTTKDVLIRTLNKSIEEGWEVDETVKALEELDLADYQAARIVRTEITRAANAGSQVASESFPYEQQKEWLATHDGRTRHAHMRLDGIVVDEQDYFIDEDGNALRFPGDPEASAETTINCRCSMAVVAKVNERGRLIPKQNVAA